MDNPKTMEELIQRMDSLAMDLEWKQDEFNAVLYLTHENGNTCYNMFGNGGAMVNALVMMMVKEDKFRKVMFAAHETYIDYVAKKAAPVFEPIIRQVEKAKDEMISHPVGAVVPCLFSTKLKPKN